MADSALVLPAVTIADVDVWYDTPEGRYKAVRGAAFTVARGEFFGLVGGSGSGKSTLLRVLAGLWDAFSGDVRIGEVQLVPGKPQPRAFHRHAQMVFQDPYGSLNPRHTIDRILADGLKLHGFAGIDARIVRLLDQVGLGAAFRFRFPHELSGGQRQRVAIARALALEPELLLLDEPTSALDTSVQAEILNLLAAIRRDTGLTAVLVTHDLGVVAHLCDRLAVMQKGEVIETLDVAGLERHDERLPYTRALVAAAFGA